MPIKKKKKKAILSTLKKKLEVIKIGKQPAYKAKMVKRDSKLQFKNKLEEAIYNHPNYKKQKF